MVNIRDIRINSQIRIMLPYEKIAKILRAPKEEIKRLEQELGKRTDRKKVLGEIIKENDTAIENRLAELGLGKRRNADKVNRALISKVENDNTSLFESLDKPKLTNRRDLERVLGVALEAANHPKGFFLKKEKAARLLEQEPPKHILKALGYKNVSMMLAKEELSQVFAALRFLEEREWLNNVFFKQYGTLKASDFEERDIAVQVLDARWATRAEPFVRKKLHNVSHLKELGLIFVIPIELGIAGELLRMFSLLLHYLNEVPYYSHLFKKYSKDADFSRKIISLLRGSVPEEKNVGDPDKIQWFIVQRYLAKEDPNDWRLFVPHVNPEGRHWDKAQNMLISAGSILKNFSADLRFWQGLNWVGDYFRSESGGETLVSFNLVDTIMSLVVAQEGSAMRYFYHHQEVLWNKIFISYFGEEKMKELVDEHIIKGWFEV